MPIFIKENQKLNGKVYKIPDYIATPFKNTLYSYEKYANKDKSTGNGQQVKGLRYARNLINHDYNKRSDNINKPDNGMYMTYNELKKSKFMLGHMGKSYNKLEKMLYGGTKMKNYVNDKLKQIRGAVAPELKREKAKTIAQNQTKPTVAPTQPVKLETANTNLTESYNSDESPYVNYLCDYDISYVFNAFENHDNLWLPLINPDMYQKALSEFTKYGNFVKFPTKYIYQWMGIIMKNTALLRACTEIAGHDMYSPLEDFIDYYFYNNDNEEKWEKYKLSNGYDEDDDNSAMFDFLENKGFFDWYVLPDGTDAISDFGIEPIEKIIDEYNSNLPPEKVLVLINRILDVYHTRGDLASIFITGGSKTLSQISEAKKIKKIYIKENKLNLLKELDG